LEAVVTRRARVAHIATVDLTVRFLLLNQLRRLRDEGYEVTAISAPGPWRDSIEEEGITFVPWPHATRSLDPVADARAFAELIGILRRERFDLVHTHTPKAGILGRIAARAVGVPAIVNTVHGLYATPEDRFARRAGVLAAERVAAGCSDVELYQSEEDLRWARRIRLVRRGQGLLLGNGCDLSRFDPGSVPSEQTAKLREDLGITKDALVVGTIGRLVAEKGYRELFAAARAVRREIPEARFLVVGQHESGKSDAIRPDEVAAAKNDIVFAGWREDTPELLSAMDVFALPSWREGVPRSAIEAAAMARPLVLTDIRGCREVVRDGREGLLVPVRSSARLAGAISGLLRDGDRRARMGAASRARAQDRFDERRVEELVVRAYERLLPRRPSSSGELRFRSARPEDAPAIARLHREALPEAFLPTLGDRFLSRLYRALGSDPRGVVLVAENGAGVVGFAAGTASVREFYRRFYRRHGLQAAVAAAPRLVRPSVLRRMRETARYPDTARALPEAELLAIAVEGGHREEGVGRELADRLLADLRRRGVGSVRVVVAAANHGANSFYERLGFRRAETIDVHRGTPSNVWVTG
jgi:glycosyltransferase involved in cell wall biosynthesis/ribosomal protein S18 acetylase RimI-like enzyme